MPHPLAIATPSFGVLSQTFVRRHVEDLLPGRTVVVAEKAEAAGRSDWKTSTPAFILNRSHPGLLFRAARAARWRLGATPTEWPTYAVRRFLEAHGVRMVLGEHLDSALRWLPVARSLGIPFFAHAHGYDVSLRLREAHWRDAYLAYNDAAGVITMSEVSRQRLIGIGLAPALVHVVPYGVDVPDAPPSREGRSGVRCLAVGRMVAKKAPITTLDAFRRTWERRRDDGLHLDFVGDGPLLPAAREYVRCFGLEPVVTLHGARSPRDVMAMMTEADIFVQHSITSEPDGNEEGLPVAILEAMALGLPVVSTRHAGIPEAVIEGDTGLLVDEGDSAGMAVCLGQLMADPTRRVAMGRAGWARARSHFSWPLERSRLVDLMALASS